MMWNIKNCTLLWIFSKSAVLPPEMLFIDLRNPNKHLEYDESTSYDIQVTFSMIFQACSSLKMMWNINNCMLLWIFSKNGLKSACLHLWSVNSLGKFFRLILLWGYLSYLKILVWVPKGSEMGPQGYTGLVRRTDKLTLHL